jgi:HK97 family phage portal protein
VNWLQRVLRSLKRAPSTPQLLSPWQNGRPQGKTWDEAKAIKEGFKLNPYVYACIDLKASAAASAPWKVLTRPSPADDWEPEPGHPLEDLIEYPNAKMTRQDLIERWVQHLDTGGNALWSMTMVTSLREDRKFPAELWPLDPSGLRPVPDREKFIRSYDYMKDGTWMTGADGIPAEDVLHFMRGDPANPYWGMGPLQAAASAVDTDVQASAWNRSIFANRAVPDGVFSIDRPLTEEEWEQARREIRLNYQGTENARTPWVLGSGAKWEMMSWKATDLDYIEGRRFTREELCAVFHVPPPMVGILESATLANVAEYRKAFWTDGVIPMLDNLKGVMNRVLVPMFGDRRLIMLDYDLSGVEVLRQDEDKRSQVLERLVKSGMPFNDAKDLLDYDVEDQDGGEIGLVPSTLIPLKDVTEISKQTLRMGDSTIANTDANTRWRPALRWAARWCSSPARWTTPTPWRSSSWTAPIPRPTAARSTSPSTLPGLDTPSDER